MIRRWIAGGLCALLLAGLAGCVSTKPKDEPEAFAHALGLTAEQRKEDFAYFEQELRKSYPCWGILEREEVDYEAIFDEYREMVAQEDSDLSFYVAINSALFRLGGAGHLSLMQPEWYEGFRSAYADSEDRTKWDETLNAPAVQEGYSKLEKMLREAYPEDEELPAEEQAAENMTALVIEEGKIAYLKIDSFDGTYDADKDKVAAFLDKVRGYEHLIIDITQNSGGSDFYWMELLAAPLANETMSSTNYALVRSCDNTSKYLEEAFGADELHPISELPALPQLEARDRELATHYIKNTLTVEPDGSGFGGKIWLLVGERVYSAAEAFTVFCKDTGFAEVVGSPTGGDGIGIDPVFLVLPNSGMLIRYSPLFGLNPDGSSNEEYGTTPDLVSPEGENALVTALRAIRQET